MLTRCGGRRRRFKVCRRSRNDSTTLLEGSRPIHPSTNNFTQASTEPVNLDDDRKTASFTTSAGQNVLPILYYNFSNCFSLNNHNLHYILGLYRIFYSYSILSKY